MIRCVRVARRDDLIRKYSKVIAWGSKLREWAISDSHTTKPVEVHGNNQKINFVIQVK